MSCDDRENYPSSSALGRYMECNASYHMELMAREWKHVPPDDDQWADAGTRIHAAIFDGTPEMLESDDERNLYSKIVHKLNQFLVYWHAEDSDHVIREQRLWLHDSDGLFPVFSGQADHIRIKGTEGLILDLKTGWNRPPDPVSNHQLRSLAVLLKTAHPELINITLQIISPYYEFRPHCMNRFELSRYEKELREFLADIVKPHTPVPGDYCKHCKGILICPEVRRRSVGLVKLEKELDFPLSLPGGAKGAKILSECNTLEKFIAKVREHYKVMIAQDPVAVPGWCLRPGAKIRSFISSKEAFPILQELLGDKVLDTITISVAKAEEKLGNGQQIPPELIAVKQNAPSLSTERKRKLAP